MKRGLLYIVFIIILIPHNIICQEFSSEQKSTIASETDKILEDYRKYGALSENGKNISSLYVSKFKNLFKNTTNIYIYNDIDPEQLMDTSITVMEYLFKVQTWYTDGLDIDLSWDAALISEPVSIDGSDEKYVVSILLQKQVMGVYKAKSIQNETDDLFFIIEFEKAGRTLRDFKIAGIQKERPVLERPKKIIVQRIEEEKEEVIFISISGRPLYTRIYSKDIFNDEYWQAEGGIGYSGGLGVLYKLDKSYGVYAGLSVSNYKSYLKLENFDNEGNTTLLTDKDGDEYFRYVQSDIEEWNSLTFMDLSLGAYLEPMHLKNLSPYISAGIQLSYKVTGNYKVKGTSTHTGYYPAYHVLLYDLEDYDFTTENLDSESSWDLSPVLVSAYFSCGVRIKLGKIGYLNAGPAIVMGLTDLKYDVAKHRDDYVSTIEIPARTVVQGGGINVSFEFSL